jgi:hypothetical protein
MSYHKNPEPRHADTHATRVTFNGPFMSASIALGDLLFIRRYSAWHNEQPLYQLRFRRGSIDMCHDALVQLVRQGQESLVAPEREVNCSGAYCEVEDAG